MKATGNLLKMKTEYIDNEIHYQLHLDDSEIDMNALIGKHISFHFQNQINCISCGKKTSKSFGQGFCYNCFQTAPEAGECTLHPEKCKAQIGEARNMDFAVSHCLIPHYVYLAVASGIKVGVTRNTQIPTRWIDQGAWKGVIIAETPNRHIAGIIEVFLKKYYSDKTNWRNMLKDIRAEEIDLLNEKSKALSLLPEELKKYAFQTSDICELNYPVNTFPSNPKSVTFDKETFVSGKLNGIKGQYLLFDEDRVLNIRRHSGYLISIESD